MSLLFCNKASYSIQSLHNYETIQIWNKVPNMHGNELWQLTIISKNLLIYSIANIAIWLAMLLDIYSLIYIEYTDE